MTMASSQKIRTNAQPTSVRTNSTLVEEQCATSPTPLNKHMAV
jgi:hypothetical protein